MQASIEPPARRGSEAATLLTQNHRKGPGYFAALVDVEDEVGELGSVTRRFADAGINVDLVYLATDTRLVLGMDDLDAGRALV